MRNLLALLGLVIVVVAVVGYYQQWYVIEKTPDGSYHLSFDTTKAKADVVNAEQKVEGAITGKK